MTIRKYPCCDNYPPLAAAGSEKKKKKKKDKAAGHAKAEQITDGVKNVVIEDNGDRTSWILLFFYLGKLTVSTATEKMSLI